MTTKKARRPLFSLAILSLCLVFLALNGIIGGYFMLSDPNGTPFGMPLSTLDNTLFQNWFIPGLILLFVWGGGSIVVLLVLWLRPYTPSLEWVTQLTHEHWVWVMPILLGLTLVIWLTYQLFTLPAIAPIQYVLYALAIVLVVVPMLPGMRQYYGIQKRER